MEGAQQTPAKPIPITPHGRAPAPAPMKLSTPTQPRLSSIQTQAQALGAGVMSPVNQNGCFEFDRIIKAGSVLKRTRKTRVGRPLHTSTCVRHANRRSNGSQSISSCDPTACRSTKTRLRPNCATR